MKNNSCLASHIVSTDPVVIKDAYSHDLMTQGVVILMATYNGGRFIEEQIRSIQEQSYSNWALYVRDDGSYDDTVQKVLEFELKDHRIKLVRDEFGNQGTIGNFSILMKFALEKSADYVFFADQDDVWKREKLATMLGAMRELELTYGNHIPLLVHCDLVVVNETLRPISSSFVKYSRLTPCSSCLGVLLCQNQVTGCASLINRTLLDLACPVPSNVLMHDWWIALLAAATGKIGFISKQLILYRQHSGNVLGAISFSQRLKKFLVSPQRLKRHTDVMKRSFVQAGMLEERILSRDIAISQSVIEQIKTYSQILSRNPFNRASILRQQKIGRNAIRTGWIFNILILAMKDRR